jgi:hypothetical protein
MSLIYLTVKPRGNGKKDKLINLYLLESAAHSAQCTEEYTRIVDVSGVGLTGLKVESLQAIAHDYKQRYAKRLSFNHFITSYEG